MYWGLLSWLAFGVVSAFVARSKGRGGCAWFALGVLLGPIGLALAFIANPRVEAPERAAAARERKKKPPPEPTEPVHEVLPPRELVAGQWSCPRCGAANPDRSPRCGNCGYSTDE